MILHPEEGVFLFYCPGCKCGHQVDDRWIISGPDHAPTIRPSVLINKNTSFTCHSFITNGEIQFLSDCYHELAGKTVKLSPYKDML